jgi:hypothetical protein
MALYVPGTQLLHAGWASGLNLPAGQFSQLV